MEISGKVQNLDTSSSSNSSTSNNNNNNNNDDVEIVNNNNTEQSIYIIRHWKKILLYKATTETNDDPVEENSEADNVVEKNHGNDNEKENNDADDENKEDNNVNHGKIDKQSSPTNEKSSSTTTTTTAPISPQPGCSKDFNSNSNNTSTITEAKKGVKRKRESSTNKLMMNKKLKRSVDKNTKNFPVRNHSQSNVLVIDITSSDDESSTKKINNKQDESKPILPAMLPPENDYRYGKITIGSLDITMIITADQLKQAVDNVSGASYSISLLKKATQALEKSCWSHVVCLYDTSNEAKKFDELTTPPSSPASSSSSSSLSLSDQDITDDQDALDVLIDDQGAPDRNELAFEEDLTCPKQNDKSSITKINNM